MDVEEELTPARPSDEGVPEGTPDLAQIEPAHILANQARDRLESRGFSYPQIREWAEVFVAREGGTADVQDFIDWIAEYEG